MSYLYICPKCKKNLHGNTSTMISCQNCGAEFAIERDVVRFLEHDDAFYEGAYQNNTKYKPRSERFYHVWPLWLINSGYLWAARKYIAKDAKVLELGCAGGVDYFSERFEMIGCDLSFSSLVNLKAYKHRVQADATACIPFPDNSIDAVVSSYFWEHILPSDKPKILAELKRVLKPGGIVLFLFDVETANPLISWFKRRSPQDYQRLFLDGDGHIGYETPAENARLMVGHDFTIIKHAGFEKSPLQSAPAYTKLAQFDSPFSGILSALGRMLGGPLFIPHTLLMRLVDTFIGPLLPTAWARIDLIIARKT